MSELRLKYNLKILLKISKLAKSVYYYTLAKENKDAKNKEIIEKLEKSLLIIKKGMVIAELH